MAERQEINKARRLKKVDGKYYGYREFECANEDVVANMEELDNSQWGPESIPGGCVCKAPEATFDYAGRVGKTVLACHYKPEDDWGGRRRRRPQYAQLVTYPSGHMRKIKKGEDRVIGNEQTIEGYDTTASALFGLTQWIPQFDNRVPDGKMVVVVKTAFPKTDPWGLLGAVGFMGQVNRDAFKIDWLPVNEEALMYLGPKTRTGFDNTLIDIDHTFLFDPEGWNDGKKTMPHLSVLTETNEVRAASQDDAPGNIRLTLTGKKLPERKTLVGFEMGSNQSDDGNVHIVPRLDGVEVKAFSPADFSFIKGLIWW